MVSRIKPVKKSPVSKKPKSKSSKSSVKSSYSPVKTNPSSGLTTLQKAAIGTALSLGVLGIAGYAGRNQIKKVVGKAFLSDEEKRAALLKNLETKRVSERKARLDSNASVKKLRLQALEDDDDKRISDYEYNQLVKQRRINIKKDLERDIREDRVNNLQAIRDAKEKKDDYTSLMIQKNIIEGNSWKNLFIKKPKTVPASANDKARKILGI